MIICLLLLAFGLAKATLVADQASNFPTSPEASLQFGCGEACQAALAQGNAEDLEIFGTHFDFDFYATAMNFTGSKPGDILKVKPINSSIIDVPSGVAVYKIQYTSVDLDNSLVPATGFVAFPFVRSQEPLKLVAYAHGTSGVFRGCAPSTSPKLFDYQSWQPLLLAGYAVVATDYAGLGNNYTAHKYVASAANADDTFWSVAAAHNAFPNTLSKEWVSIGHSQGGGTVWKLSEHEAVNVQGSGYLGGISVAPVTKLYDMLVAGLGPIQQAMNQGIDLSGEDFLGLGVLPSAISGIQAVFPGYEAPWASKALMQRIELARIGQLCDSAISRSAIDLRTDAITNVSVTSDQTLLEFQKINAPAQGSKASQPLLLILGSEDAIVSEQSAAATFASSCNFSNPIHMSVYPGLDHTAVLTASSPEWLTFISDRFAGKSLLQKCSNFTMAPFDLEHAKKPLDSY
ncbi:unnamed protein product [Penicillium salamii]|nr:unnamed protein product [Penicillium salamii]